MEKGNLKIETIEDLKEFLKLLFAEENVEIYLFGSTARGDNTIFFPIK